MAQLVGSLFLSEKFSWLVFQFFTTQKVHRCSMYGNTHVSFPVDLRFLLRLFFRHTGAFVPIPSFSACSNIKSLGIGPQMTSIFEGQPPKTRPFPIKTRVTWVPGVHNI